MVAGTVYNEIMSQVSPARLWKAISITILEGDGGPGTIRQSNFTDAIKDFSYWKDRVDAIDEENRVFKYSVIEGGLIGKKVKSTSFELKFEARKDGGSICKLNGEYETTEDSLPTKAETKEMMGSMVSMFKAIEGYLVANPAAYA
ncbi:major pollen allergen Bet v 1-F/I [Cinnamomum micranthum f. kanehirae]|uniref:Major pollen allergen Bet v 1-F/I n=1 Tax=Cinnamomum micranthum f. kanehirae TaxID=337451 RepID=A0A443PHE9_9MAGN|nr:major pollen allergen Bet v 1-F/I [Cinnamomum micranthum f. kanehirae]